MVSRANSMVSTVAPVDSIGRPSRFVRQNRRQALTNSQNDEKTRPAEHVYQRSLFARQDRRPAQGSGLGRARHQRRALRVRPPGPAPRPTTSCATATGARWPSSRPRRPPSTPPKPRRRPRPTPQQLERALHLPRQRRGDPVLGVAARGLSARRSRPSSRRATSSAVPRPARSGAIR